MTKTFINSIEFFYGMKAPKEMKRYCPKCKTHSLHKVKQEKSRGRNKAHPLSKYSMTRLASRRIGQEYGTGNAGRYSRGAMNSWKQYNKKLSKRIDLRFTCPQCNKVSVPADRGKRSKRIMVE